MLPTDDSPRENRDAFDRSHNRARHPATPTRRQWRARLRPGLARGGRALCLDGSAEKSGRCLMAYDAVGAGTSSAVGGKRDHHVRSANWQFLEVEIFDN